MEEPVQIHPLQTFTRDELLPILTGYETLEQYRVELAESDALSTFTIRLVRLALPYRADFHHDFEEEDFQRYLALLPQGFSFGAYQAGRLVAFAICEAKRWNQTLWIWEFHVMEDFRGQGIGRTLMEQVCARARQAGLTHAYLETQNTNVNAVRFYRKMGFSLDALDFSQYYGLAGHEGVVSFHMKRKL